MAFEILARLGLNATGFQSGLKRAQSLAGSWGKSISGSISGQLAAAFGGAALAAGIKRSIDRAGQINDSAAAVGLTAERYQELEFAASQSGASIENVTTAIRQMAKAQAAVLSNGDKGAIAAFADFGVSIDDIKSKNAPALFDQAADRLKDGASSTALLTSAMSLFGKSGATVLPMMFNGLQQTTERARELGIVLGDETISNLDDLGDRFDELVAQFETGFAIITNGAAGFAAKFSDVMEATFTGVLVAFQKVLDVFDDFKNKRSDPKDFSKNFFSAASAGFKEGFEGAVIDQGARDAERNAARAKRREALLKAQQEVPEAGLEKFKPAQLRTQTSVNQLQRIGAQVGGTSKADEYLKKQVELQKKIEANTRNSTGEIIP